MSLERIVADLVQKIEQRFYGKYRGFVVDNADPEQLGRLKLKVPSVLGSEVVTGWATPCVPYGGDANQGFLFIPEKDSGVWVEFEEGDLEFPIWVGAFWSKPGGESELPKPNEADGTEQSSVQDPLTRKIIKTKWHTIQFEDEDDEAMIIVKEGKNGHVITLDKEGIKITDGANGHEIILDNSGIAISDGVSSDNKIILEQSGLTVQDKNGNKIILGAGGIQVGSSGATEPFVLGNQFMANVSSFMIALSTHTHVGNLGAPTSPPVAPMNLQVPLSTKHKVE